ncbi:MAG: SufB/SufD family protein [Acidimicrobiales bacterium]
MTTFADAATSFIALQPDAENRARAWAAFEALGLPTTTDEVWRYAPLGEFSLDRFAPSATTASRVDGAIVDDLARHAGLVVRVVDGVVTSTGTAIEGVSVSAEATSRDDTLSARYADDAFAQLNAALSPATITVRVARGARVARPVVIVHRTDAHASFPRTIVTLEEGADATVVEYYDGGEDALVVPISEYRVGENAVLRLVTYQRLAPSAWHVARSTGVVARDGRLLQAVVGLGGYYDRSRNDAVLAGAGSHNELRTTFLGAGRQVHDFRTHQLHVGAHSSSLLLSKGAVADESRSIYTGLIEIEHGARRTDARQTNHNLLLSPHAHADSVPNLDIRENDVRCAHASSVGPLDEMQRWYLESRGVTPADAQRLMIRGFYNEMLVALPAQLAQVVERDVTSVLESVTAVAS